MKVTMKAPLAAAESMSPDDTCQIMTMMEMVMMTGMEMVMMTGMEMVMMTGMEMVMMTGIEWHTGPTPLSTTCK